MLQDKIIRFNNKLNKYNYGIIVNNKVFTGSDINFDLYKTISPDDFIKYKTGVCWDYVEVEARVFQNDFHMHLTTNWLLYDKEFSLYYMQHIDKDGECPTHTWLAYKLDDTIYSFESSWKSIRGIKSWTDENQMMSFYLDKQTEYVLTHTHNELYGFAIFKYKPFTIFNLDPESYMNYIYDNGIVIKSTIPSYKVMI